MRIEMRIFSSYFIFFFSIFFPSPFPFSFSFFFFFCCCYNCISLQVRLMRLVRGLWRIGRVMSVFLVRIGRRGALRIFLCVFSCDCFSLLPLVSVTSKVPERYVGKEILMQTHLDSCLNGHLVQSMGKKMKRMKVRP